MPFAPRPPCAHPGCGQPVPCAQHARPAWGHARPVSRLRGRALQRRRAELFARQPLCQWCAREGRVTLATIRDHIVPLAEGGAETESNVQALCQACSDVKTQQEATRGKARS